jgi:FtsP/CotA-like multicopper oxidase with cupredoxin domain
MFTRRALLGASLVTLASGSTRAEGENFVVWEAREGTAELLPHPAPATRIWGFEGRSPGPILRVKLGQELRLRLTNKLPQNLAPLWRGMRLPNSVDGVKRPPMAQGESRDYVFTPPDVGLFLLQPSPLHGEALSRGLAGLVIVEEPDPVFAHEELNLVLTDWRLGADAQLTPDFDHPADVLRQGRIGAVATANGAVRQVLEFAPGTRLRLRLANAASARMMTLGFDGPAPQIFGVDGQFCDPFTPARKVLPLAPGARFDGVLDLSPLEGGRCRLILRGEAELPDAVVLEIVTKGAARPPAPPLLPPKLNPLLPAEIHLEKAKRIELLIEGGIPASAPANYRPPGDLRQVWKINGKAGGLDGPPLFSVRAGTPVSLALVNKCLFPLAIFVQGHAMRLLHDLDDGWEPYWRDTVVAPEKTTKHVAFVADNPGQWFLGDSIADHAAHGLAGWFEVT